jgi:NAD(P)-dependent dehydrogenase (short-subunit alcohol dehydrogenase family)
MKLSDRVALVTGSSRGIGRAVAEALAAEGARVVVNARSQETAEEVAEELGGGAIGIGADLSRPEECKSLIAAAIQEAGRLEILVNNAGMPMVRDSIALSLEEWQATLDLNLTAPFLCAQLAARHMLEAKRGVIINIGSITSFAAFPRRLAYATTKAGLVMMTRVMAIEWAPDVRVNAIAPGFIETDLVLGLASEGKVDLEALRRRTPRGRLGTPADVARAAVFLASDDADFVTGETLVSDGGWLAYGFV